MFVFLLSVLSLKHIPFYFPTHSGLWLGLLICVIIQTCFFTTLIFKLNWKKVTEQVGHDKSNISSQAAIVEGSWKHLIMSSLGPETCRQTCNSVRPKGVIDRTVSPQYTSFWRAGWRRAKAWWWSFSKYPWTLGWHNWKQSNCYVVDVCPEIWNYSQIPVVITSIYMYIFFAHLGSANK